MKELGAGLGFAFVILAFGIVSRLDQIIKLLEKFVK